MNNQLSKLRSVTSVVADTGDIDAIRQHQPTDATTNPSLILKAAELPQYQELIRQCITKAVGDDHETIVNDACDRLAVAIGVEILSIIPGVISTEVDARLSFDSEQTYRKAKKIIALYDAYGIDKQRVLIKIAATWEGIQAAARLEKEGISCNLTLIFSFAQAAACAAADATLISPFVGRILDWYKSEQPTHDFSGANDPGVISVSEIYNYYKANDIKTIVMGASFRNIDEIAQLAGCDKLTISPSLLAELADNTDPLPRKLSPQLSKSTHPIWQPTETEFRWHLNDDAMATDKLSEGIRKFAKDQVTLFNLLGDYRARLA